MKDPPPRRHRQSDGSSQRGHFRSWQAAAHGSRRMLFPAGHPRLRQPHTVPHTSAGTGRGAGGGGSSGRGRGAAGGLRGARGQERGATGAAPVRPGCRRRGLSAGERGRGGTSLPTGRPRRARGRGRGKEKATSCSPEASPALPRPAPRRLGRGCPAQPSPAPAPQRAARPPPPSAAAEPARPRPGRHRAVSGRPGRRSPRAAVHHTGRKPPCHAAGSRRCWGRRAALGALRRGWARRRGVRRALPQGGRCLPRPLARRQARPGQPKMADPPLPARGGEGGRGNPSPR